jgi:hypothetical protein
VRTALVILPPPPFDLGLCIGQRQEPVCIEALVTQSTVEGFDKGIVGRFARPGEVQRYAIGVGPAIERLRDKLGSIVDPDRAG